MDCSGCVVLVPVYSSLEPETDAALRELAQRGYTVRTLRGSSAVDLARSTLATEAVTDGFAETLWIDADTVFHPDDVERLRSHGLPLVAGLYLRKGPREFAARFRSPRATFGVGGGLLEMVYVGMGCTLVRREVYEQIARTLPVCGGGYGGKPVTPYFLPLLAQVEGEGLTYLSEDYSFCERARRAGFAVMADTTLKLGHVGRYVYTWDEFAPREPFDRLELGVTLASEEDTEMNEIDRLKKKIEQIELEARQMEQNWTRCAGALQVLRGLLEEATAEQQKAIVDDTVAALGAQNDQDDNGGDCVSVAAHRRRRRQKSEAGPCCEAAGDSTSLLPDFEAQPLLPTAS